MEDNKALQKLKNILIANPSFAKSNESNVDNLYAIISGMCKKKSVNLGDFLDYVKHKKYPNFYTQLEEFIKDFRVSSLSVNNKASSINTVSEFLKFKTRFNRLPMLDFLSENISYTDGRLCTFFTDSTPYGIKSINYLYTLRDNKITNRYVVDSILGCLRGINFQDNLPKDRAEIENIVYKKLTHLSNNEPHISTI